jgi:hypothetical protein
MTKKQMKSQFRIITACAVVLGFGLGLFVAAMAIGGGRLFQ